MRFLARCIDRFGNISVDVTVGDGPGAEKHETGASSKPDAVARFLRELADDVEAAGQFKDSRKAQS